MDMGWLLKYLKGEITFLDFVKGDPNMKLFEHNFNIKVEYSIDKTRNYLKKENII